MLKVYASHLACLYFQKTCDALEVVVWTFIFRCIIFFHRWHTYYDTDLVIICPVNGWCAIVIQCMSTDLAENEFHNITCKHFAVHSLFCIWQFSSYKVCNTREKKMLMCKQALPLNTCLCYGLQLIWPHKGTTAHTQ